MSDNDTEHKKICSTSVRMETKLINGGNQHGRQEK